MKEIEWQAGDQSCVKKKTIKHTQSLQTFKKKTGRACITRRITAQFTAHSSRYFSSPLYPFFFPYPRICTAGDAGWAAGCNVRPYGPAVLLGLNVVGADVPQDGRDGHLFGGPGPAAVLKTEKKIYYPVKAQRSLPHLSLSSRQAEAAGKAKFLLS
jgi:hypothetical protein